MLALALVAAACGGDDDDGSTSTDDATATSAATTTPTTGGASDQTLQATLAGSSGQGDSQSGDDGQNGDDGDGEGEGEGEGDDPTETTAPSGFCPGAQPTAIRFQTGGTSATIDTPASAGQIDLYTLDVGDDQIISVSLESDDPAAEVELADPGDDDGSDPFREMVVSPSRAGTYRICVAAGPDGADYRLIVRVVTDNSPTRIDAPWCGDTVNDRGPIRFAAGAFSASVEQGVIRGERDLYSIEAAAGQDIDLFLISLEDNAVFDLRSPSGELLIDEVSDFRIPLPEDGVYLICVGSTRGNASYVLDVAIA